ncbi:MAG: RtcB family protein, partial [Cellulomonadaceae bacterium]|nr:RtcB family protein [Cellulomonadaceae bacterium]
IENAIPLSAGNYNRTVSDNASRLIAELEEKANESKIDPGQFSENWRLQLGSLGSGNHFIEISKDESSQVWLFLHSGSRGIGNKIAQHHIQIANSLMKKWWIPLPHDSLAYLVEGTDEFDEYLRGLLWAQEFARLNREEMMHRVKTAVSEFMNDDVRPVELINCHHNFTQKEHHYRKDVWVSRKGAISAQKGEMGLIPGSMGTPSYIVSGKGNPLSLCSSPHGAGRNYSRTQARKMFTIEDLAQAMGNIEYRHSAAFIDEIPAAYKPIEQVMADSEDLVEVVHELRQLMNVKGN